LASIVSAAAYIIAAALFPKRLVDAEGNPVPSGPAGFPIIGTLHSLHIGDHCLCPQYAPLTYIQYRMLPVLVSLS
jgi:hypothetical protein